MKESPQNLQFSSCKAVCEKLYNANYYCVLWDLPFSAREVKTEWIMNKTWKFPKYMHHHQAQSQTIWILLMINPLWSESTILESAAGVPLVRLYWSETPNLRKDGSKISFAATISEKSNDICPAGVKRDGRIWPLSKVKEKSLISVEKGKRERAV